jgi:integrase
VAAQRATGMDPTPHEFRHSYVTHLRAAGVDDADLARVAGHTIETMISVYTHALERSYEKIRGIIG